MFEIVGQILELLIWFFKELVILQEIYVVIIVDFKNGLVLVIDGQLWIIIEFQYVKLGKGLVFVCIKLKNVFLGKVVDKMFNVGVKVDIVIVDWCDIIYFYCDGLDFVFMDS